MFDFYPETREILLALYDADIPIALASSTWAPRLLDVVDHFNEIEDVRLLEPSKWTQTEHWEILCLINSSLPAKSSPILPILRET